MNDILVSMLVTLLVLIGIFLLFREFWCWYWKINQRIALLEKIENHLSGGNESPKQPEKEQEKVPVQESEKSESDPSICAICGFKNMAVETNCQKCGAPL